MRTRDLGLAQRARRDQQAGRERERDRERGECRRISLGRGSLGRVMSLLEQPSGTQGCAAGVRDPNSFTPPLRRDLPA